MAEPDDDIRSPQSSAWHQRKHTLKPPNQTAETRARGSHNMLCMCGCVCVRARSATLVEKCITWTWRLIVCSNQLKDFFFNVQKSSGEATLCEPDVEAAAQGLMNEFKG